MGTKDNLKKMSELLGTSNTAEQLDRVQRLLNMVVADVITVVLQVDTRTGDISIGSIGARQQEKMDVDFLYAVLDAARKQIQEAERATLLQKSQPQTGEAGDVAPVEVPEVEVVEETEE